MIYKSKGDREGVGKRLAANAHGPNPKTIWDYAITQHATTIIIIMILYCNMNFMRSSS